MLGTWFFLSAPLLQVYRESGKLSHHFSCGITGRVVSRTPGIQAFVKTWVTWVHDSPVTCMMDCQCRDQRFSPPPVPTLRYFKISIQLAPNAIKCVHCHLNFLPTIEVLKWHGRGRLPLQQRLRRLLDASFLWLPVCVCFKGLFPLGGGVNGGSPQGLDPEGTGWVEVFSPFT